MSNANDQILKSLTQEQIDEFRGRGFVRIGPLLDDELVAELRQNNRRLGTLAGSASASHFIDI